METAQPLSIESFSYRWLVNLKPSLDSLENSFRTSLEASDEACSYIEMDPRLPPSKRFFKTTQDFKFDFPISQSDDSLRTFVHADELISNGLLMPLFIDPVKIKTYESSSSIIQSIPTTSTTTQYSPQAGLPACNSGRPASSKCKRLSKRILEKYLNFLRPLYRRIRNHKASSKVDKNVQGVNNRVHSSEKSPRISVAYSADDWRRSCDSDSSIYEAVLHCKRSIGVKCLIDHQYYNISH